jgi:guanosine-3',5'-bis(diphosphate) 3'-pyrophosphohydrolase
MVFAIHESGKNPKPVILHSMRVGFHLYNLGYNKDLVIAAILHDVIEDTDVESKEIEKKFSRKVLKLVEANSFDKRIKNKTERYKENFKRCSKAGKDALIIKAADFFDNLDYYHLSLTEKLVKFLFEKLKYFIDISRDKLKNETLYNDLVKKYKEIIKTI